MRRLFAPSRDSRVAIVPIARLRAILFRLVSFTLGLQLSSISHLSGLEAERQVGII